MSIQASAPFLDPSSGETEDSSPEQRDQPQQSRSGARAVEWEDFAIETYRKRIAKRLPGFVESADLGAQWWCARRLSASATRWMLADCPVKTLWQHLGADELKALRREALRGFQQAASSLRREAVQKRLAAWLEQNPDEKFLLLLRWGERQPRPPVAEAVEEQSDESALRDNLFSLVRAFGLDAVSVALAFVGQARVSGELEALAQDEETLRQTVENAPPYGAPATEPPAEESPAVATSPAPDSQSAQFWHRESQELRAQLEQFSATLSEARAALARGAGDQARVRALETEVAVAKKRETQNAAQFAKKLEQVERKWAAKYEELGKVEAREARRMRALQGQIEALEADNKRFKRQVRQSAQLREEERRKTIALEAQLAQLRARDANESAPVAASLDAVSSPPTTQEAPNRPVKVSKPSPLDEIFEWNAHGRRVRLTAREVRRLIDKNDEERVGTVMLELDALQESAPELRRKFLERLSGAGSYYERVLTRATTRVLVDASNVARFRNNRYGKGQLCHLHLMRQELQRLDCWPIVFIADASLPYNIDQPHELREMARHGEIVLTDKGVEADEILARQARATGAYVVTNDARFFYKVSPDYEPPRITFRVLDGLVVVDEF